MGEVCRYGCQPCNNVLIILMAEIVAFRAIRSTARTHSGVWFEPVVCLIMPCRRYSSYRRY